MRLHDKIFFWVRTRHLDLFCHNPKELKRKRKKKLFSYVNTLRESIKRFFWVCFYKSSTKRSLSHKMHLLTLVNV